MTRDQVLAQLDACVATCRASEPLTDAERALHRMAVAKVAAEDDRRRAPTPQLQLPEAA